MYPQGEVDVVIADLLRKGMTYKEVSDRVNIPYTTIVARNRRHYKIPKSNHIDPRVLADIDSMCANGFTLGEIVQKTGVNMWMVCKRLSKIPKHHYLNAYRKKINDVINSAPFIDPSFGYWFSGIFDGEGHLGTTLTIRENGSFQSFSISAVIGLRDDDTLALKYIKDNLGGSLTHNGRVYTKNKNPQTTWRMSKIADIVFKLIPLFDKFKLHTKKKDEYVIWRELAVDKMVYHNLGSKKGYSIYTPERINSIQESISSIKHIRSYRGLVITKPNDDINDSTTVPNDNPSGTL